MYYLIYASQSTKDWTTEEFSELLSSSKENNDKLGITGMLVYAKRRFMQILEGERDNVKSLFEKISQDDRHKNLIVVLEGEMGKRNFNNWSMGFKKLEQSDLYDLASITDIDQLFEGDLISNSSHPAMIFLKLFYEKNIKDDLVTQF